MAWRTAVPRPGERTGWFALFAAVVVAALFTATAIVFVLVGPSHVSAPAIFLFAFTYALTAGLIVGLPVLGRMVWRGQLTAVTAALSGGAAAAVPALIFLGGLASCDHIPRVGTFVTCQDGARTAAAWGLSALLVAGLSLVGAAAGVLGYATYRAARHLLYRVRPILPGISDG